MVCSCGPVSRISTTRWRWRKTRYATVSCSRLAQYSVRILSALHGCGSTLPCAKIRAYSAGCSSWRRGWRRNPGRQRSIQLNVRTRYSRLEPADILVPETVCSDLMTLGGERAIQSRGQPMARRYCGVARGWREPHICRDDGREPHYGGPPHRSHQALA
jgi:hypothetical protein